MELEGLDFEGLAEASSDIGKIIMDAESSKPKRKPHRKLSDKQAAEKAKAFQTMSGQILMMAVQFVPGLGWQAPVSPTFPAGIPAPADVLAFNDDEALATVRAWHELVPQTQLTPEQAARLGKAGAVLSLMTIGFMKYMALKQIGEMRQQYIEGGNHGADSPDANPSADSASA